jgi:hypothetical protein
MTHKASKVFLMMVLGFTSPSGLMNSSGENHQISFLMLKATFNPDYESLNQNIDSMNRNLESRMHLHSNTPLAHLPLHNSLL